MPKKQLFLFKIGKWNGKIFWGIHIHPWVCCAPSSSEVGLVLRHLQLWIDLWVGIVWIAPAVHLMVLLHSCQSKAGTNVRLNLVQHLFPSSFLAKYKSKHCAQCSLPSFQVQLCGRFLHQWPLSWENLYKVKYFDKMQASQWHCEASLWPWYKWLSTGSLLTWPTVQIHRV